MTAKRNLFSSFLVWMMLLLLGILPLFVAKTTSASSYAAGVVLFTLISIPFIYKYTPSLKKVPKKIIYFVGFLIIHMLIQHMFVGEWFQKSYNSLFVLLYIFIVAFVSASWFKKIDIKILLHAIKILVVVLITIGFFNIVTDYRFASIYGSAKAVFPFGEPSHFALFSGMFFIIYFVVSSKMTIKVSLIVVTILLAILFPNTTMLIFALLMVMLLIRFSFKNIILFSVAIYIMFYVFSNISYFSHRIDVLGNTNNENISALVYLQGLEYAKSSLLDTYGMGIGFQMMGNQKASDITYRIIELVGISGNEGLNRQDGGFLAAKIIAEFGVFGIFILVGYIYLFFKSFLYLKKFMMNIKYDRDRNSYKLAIAHAILFSFSIEIFVRGIGYFTPTVFIFLMALVYYIKHNPSNMLRNVR